MRLRMAVVRIALERLLVLLFWIARSAFFAFVLATATTLLAAGALGGPEAPAWLEVITRSCLWIGGAFGVTTILLFVAPGLRAPAADEVEDTPPWIWLLGLSLIALPALAWASLADFVALWREILLLLDGVGFWDAFAQGGQGSGLVMLPILAALFVPSLEAIAAFFLIGAPLVLLALLPTRSRHFPRLFTLLVVCQAGLVLASGIGADAFAKLAAELSAAMSTAEDAEVGRAAGQLGHASGVLTATATAFVAPLLGHLAWLPVLLVSPRAAAFFRAGAKSEPVAAPSTAPVEPRGVPAAPASTPRPAGARERTRAATPAGARDRNASFALIALGALMLLFMVGEALRSSTHYVSSDPAPGAMLAAETLGSMREEAFSRHIPPGMNRHDYVRFRFRQALVEAQGFDLVAMGRPEGSGCYCFANDLLSECMIQLERDYRFIVIDTEAGMEHISRGTIGNPDILLIISDPGARGLRTIVRIREIATQLGLEPGRIRRRQEDEQGRLARCREDLGSDRKGGRGMRIRAQIGVVLNLDKCIGCHTCSVTCKNVWTTREGVEYAWFNNVETKPGTGYPTDWENQKRWKGGWERTKSGKLQPTPIKGDGILRDCRSIWYFADVSS